MPYYQCKSCGRTETEKVLLTEDGLCMWCARGFPGTMAEIDATHLANLQIRMAPNPEFVEGPPEKEVAELIAKAVELFRGEIKRHFVERAEECQSEAIKEAKALVAEQSQCEDLQKPSESFRENKLRAMLFLLQDLVEKI